MSRMVKTATTVAIVLAAAVALYGLFLAFIGMLGMLVQEHTVTKEGESREETTILSPTPHALLGTLAAAMILGGLLMRKLLIAWIGLAALFAYSALFLFSVGAGLLPVDIILLILLTIIQRN